MRQKITRCVLTVLIALTFAKLSFPAVSTITTFTTNDANGISGGGTRHLFQTSDGTLVLVYQTGTSINAIKSVDKGLNWTKLDGTAGVTSVSSATQFNTDFSAWMDSATNDIFVIYYISGNSGTEFTTGSNGLAKPTTTIATSTDTVATILTVASTAGFSASGRFLFDGEYIKYLNKTATTFVSCTRGANITTTLSGTITAGVTSITIAGSGGSYLTTGGTITIEAENISYALRTGTSPATLTGCTRGVNGTTAAGHNTGVTVSTCGATHTSGTTVTAGLNESRVRRIAYSDWSVKPPAQVFNEYTSSLYYPRITRDPVNGMLMAKFDYATEGQVSTSTDGGANWGPLFATGQCQTTSPGVVPLNGKILNINLSYGEQNFSSRMYDTTALTWTSATSVTGGSHGGFPTVTNDYKVHMAFDYGLSKYGVFYSQYNGTTWSTPVTLSATITTNSAVADGSPATTTDGTNVYVFWRQYYGVGQYDIVYRKYDGSTWTPALGSAPTMLSSDHLNNNYLTSPFKVNPNSPYIPVAWKEGAVSPFNIRYSRISLPPTVTGVGPSPGVNSSLTTISIVGTNFYGSSNAGVVTDISLDTSPTTALSSFSVASETLITGAVVPTGIVPGSYNILVTTGGSYGGGSNTTSAVKFVVSAPDVTVTNISPANGANESATTLSVFGSGYFGGVGTNTVTAIRLDTSPTVTTLAAGYNVVDDTLITGAVIPSGMTVGTYNVMVTASGGSNITSTVKYIVKIGPKVTGLNPLSGSNIGISTITITGSGYWPTGSAEVTSIKLMDTATEVAAITGYTAVNDSTIQTAAVAGGLSPGSYWVKVSTTNGVNATGAYFSVTTNVPTITSLTPSIGGDSGTTTISINGTGFWGGTTSNKVTQIRLETSPTASTILGYNVISNSLISNVVIPAGLDIGSYDIKVQSCGVYENVGGTKFTIANGPQVTSLSQTSSTNLTATAITVTGQYFTGASVVNLDDPLTTALGSMSVVNATTITGIIPAGLFAGTYNVKVSTPAGTNVTSTQKFTVTGLDPVVSTVVPATSVNTSAFTVTLTGTGYFGGKASGDVTSMSLVGPSTRSITTYSVISDSLMDNVVIPSQVMCGTYDVRVQTHGGENTTSGNKFVVTGVSPTVVTVTPQSNTNVTLATVTVTGTNFYGGTTSADVTSVKVGTTEFTSFSVVSNASLTGVVPTGITTGSYDVIVTTRAGVNATSDAKYIVTTSPPTVTNLSPNKGGNTGLNTISITGTKFFGGGASSAVTGIQLDTGTPTDLTSYSVISNVLITAQVPIGVAVGTYNVKVTTAGGTNTTSSVKFTSKAGPTVDIFSPSTWLNTTSKNIFIQGTNYYVNETADVLEIRLTDPNNTPIAIGAITSDIYIEDCTVPQGVIAGTYDIRVTTSNGTNYLSGDKFIVTTVPPTVVNINPLTVYNAGSSYALFTGTGFYGGTLTSNVYSMKLSGNTDVSLGEYTVLSDSVIQSVRIPIGTPAGTYDVKVTTGGGTNTTSSVQITVLSAPLSVTELSPSSGLNTTATTMTVKGIGFFRGMASSMVTSIKLDDVNNTALSGWSVLSDTQINNVIVPLGMNSGRYNVQITAGGGTNTTSYAKFDVVFDSTAATELTVESAGIKLAVPQGALSGNTVFIISDVSAATDVLASNKIKYGNLRLWPYLDSAVKEITLTNGVTINSGKTITLTLTYTGISDPTLESKFRILRLGTDNKWALASSSDSVDFINHKISSFVDNFSIFRIGQFVAAASNLDNVVIFPNPINFDTAARSTVKFKNLTSDPMIRIFTVSGEVVKTINPLYQVALTGTVNDGISGEAEWDGTNDNGERVARGIYLYMITDGSGRKKIGKIVVK